MKPSPSTAGLGLKWKADGFQRKNENSALTIFANYITVLLNTKLLSTPSLRRVNYWLDNMC